MQQAYCAKHNILSIKRAGANDLNSIYFFEKIQKLRMYYIIVTSFNIRKNQAV